MFTFSSSIRRSKALTAYSALEDLSLHGKFEQNPGRLLALAVLTPFAAVRFTLFVEMLLLFFSRDPTAARCCLPSYRMPHLEHLVLRPLYLTLEKTDAERAALLQRGAFTLVVLRSSLWRARLRAVSIQKLV